MRVRFFTLVYFIKIKSSSLELVAGCKSSSKASWSQLLESTEPLPAVCVRSKPLLRLTPSSARQSVSEASAVCLHEICCDLLRTCPPYLLHRTCY